MEKYKINGKSIEMPTGWHDVKYKDAIHILENNFDTVKIFSLFSGIPEDEVKELNKKDDIYHFLKGFPFLNRLPAQEVPSIPRSIKYKGVFYLFPHVFLDDAFDFGEISVGQIEDMKLTITNMMKEFKGDEVRDVTEMEVLKIFPPVVAIYLQAMIEKKYNYNRAMKMADELQGDLSFKEVVYIGNFFLLKLGGLITGLAKGSQRGNWMKRKSRLVFKTLMQRLASMLP